MDLNSIGQKNIKDVSTDSLWLEKLDTKPKEDAEVIDLVKSTDSAVAQGLKELKEQVKAAQEPGRAAYLEKLKLAIANDEYDVPANKLADAFDDGFLDYLSSEV